MINILIFAIIMSVTLSGCGLHKITDRLGLTNTTENPNENGTEDESADEAFSLDKLEVESVKGSGLYQLDSLIPKYENMELMGYGMRSENEILLIYKTARSFDTGEATLTPGDAESDNTDIENGDVSDVSADSKDYDDYKFTGIDLTNGELIEYPWEMKVECDEYGYSLWLNVISVNPVIMYDYSTSSIFMPESDTKNITVEEGISGELFYKNSSVYMVRYNGFISKVNEDGTLKTVYTLPDTLANMYKERGETSDTIKVSSSTYTGEPVYLDIDPMTWRGRVYTQDYYDYYICGSNENAYYALESENVEDVSRNILVVEKTGKGYRIEIPDDVMKNGGSYVNLTEVAIMGKYLLIGICDFDGNYKDFLLWDYEKGEESEIKDKEKKPYEIPVITYDDLDKRAEEIEDKYGVAVVYGENIKRDLSDFEFEVCSNSGYIMNAFDTIEETLQLYPEGFFNHLEENYVRNTIIYLTGKQSPKDATVNISDSEGVTSDENGVMTIFMNISSGTLSKSTLVHELTHAIDRRLIYDNALDEYRWNSYNPPGFEYYYGYVNENGEEYSSLEDYEYTSYYDNAYNDDYKDTYFVDVYAKTWPTEDRSRLMEYLIGMDYDDNMFHSEHMRDKLEYLSDCIRNDLGTSSWPEETSWEKKLNQYK